MLWENRDKLLQDGILYPFTGLHNSKWGPRHYKLAAYGKPQDFVDVIEEAKSHENINKVVISAERFSVKMGELIENLTSAGIKPPKLLVVVRPQHVLARSMYLQVVKSNYSHLKKDSFLLSFKEWLGSGLID